MRDTCYNVHIDIVENSGGAITAESANGVTTFTVKLRIQKC
jgi:nitrogen-specific signal transduction histidine kinase